MTQLALDLAEGRKRRDRGTAQAADHAGSEWMEAAVADFARFVRSHGEATLEAWRYDWLTRQQPAPASHKAFGAVALTASRRGLIRWSGRYRPAASPKTRAHCVRVWCVVG